MTALLLAAEALAQTAEPIDIPIDIERFKPFVDTYGYAVTESATTLGHLQVGGGFFANYSEDSVVLLTLEGERILGPGPLFADAMLDRRAIADFQAGIGVSGFFSLNTAVPVVLWQQGYEPTTPQSTDTSVAPISSGIADVRVTPKFVIVDMDRGYPVGLAVLTTVSVPTGSPRSFIGEGDVTVTPIAVFEAADGSIRKHEYQVRGALNAGARIKQPDRFREVVLGPEFVYRAALSTLPHPIVEMGVDLSGAVGGFKIPQAPVELLPWARFWAMGLASIGGGVGVGLHPGVGSPDIRAFGGATIAPSFDPLTLDRDHDGIPNRYDLCINVPEDLDGFQDEDGCPEDDNDQDRILDVNDSCPNDPEDYDNFEDVEGCPDVDNDRDGIWDPQDACVMIPEDLDGWQDADGCPEPDNDNDGIPDPVDACPNVAETVNGFQDQDGCPDEKPFVDTDRDGYQDEVDACPLQPEDFDGWQDQDGCPEPDNDLDGILDQTDQCINEPETRNGYLDEDGCPDNAPARVVVGKTKIEITEKIFFEVNKAVIKELSFELLDEVARAIKDHPKILRIQVEGHTDSDGPDAYNLRLSQSRAEAVLAYIVNAGVEAPRLVAKGFGETVPIDTNDTAEGKARNRRVEFVILVQE